MDALKKAAAKAALAYLEDDMILGVGTGSTVNYFIEELARIRGRLEGCVASSNATAAKLKAAGIPVLELNATGTLALYVDGADEAGPHGTLIKGGGGALTREKIIASASKRFICMVSADKCVKHLGAFPLAVEVLPMARSFVARAIVSLGGDPQYREGFVTDNGNCILDVFNLDITEPMALEDQINAIPGVIENGLFARRTADIVLAAGDAGVITHSYETR